MPDSSQPTRQNGLELPTVIGAPLAKVDITAYYRAESWSAFHLLAEKNEHAQGFRLSYFTDTGKPSHTAWDSPSGIRICIWAPDA